MIHLIGCGVLKFFRAAGKTNRRINSQYDAEHEYYMQEQYPCMLCDSSEYTLALPYTVCLSCFSTCDALGILTNGTGQ